MSLATWKREFYPRDAELVKSKLVAVRHSLRKWRGLTAENLAKHGMKPGSREIASVDNMEFLDIDDMTCALCQLYLVVDSDCKRCPLFAALKGKRCDATESSPYMTWVDMGDPSKMIAALEKTLAAVAKP